MEKIISLQNDKIKHVVKLRKANARRKSDSIIIEGKLEIELALRAGVNITEIFYASELAPNFDLDFSGQLTEVSEKVFSKISYRDSGDGYLALARPEYLRLEQIKLSKNPLVVVLEKISKPGNLGAILRTADAAQIDLIILNDSQVDIYNPNVVRASRGTVFMVPVVSLKQEETREFLAKEKISIYAATDKAETEYTDVDFKKPSAIVFGTEHEGLSSDWLDKDIKKIKIAMQGQADSLNVSVSAAVMIFEAKRQRKA